MSTTEETRSGWHRRYFGSWTKTAGWTILPLLAIGSAVVILLVNSLLPYQPFELRSYVVTPDPVCAGAPVVNEVTRAYTTQFKSLKLTETWVTVAVPGLAPDRPAASNTGSIPTPALHPTSGFVTVTSPLLNTAPAQPGVYRVRIDTQAFGDRWGFLPATDTNTYYSGPVTVTACHNPPGGEKP